MREFQVIDADTELNITVSRLAFDATGERLFFLLANGDVYQESEPPKIPVPALGLWGYLVLTTGLVLSALHLGRSR